MRDSAALLDATAGPAPGDPYPAPPPARPFAAEVGADPGRLRIAYTARLPGGGLGHPDCVRALDEAVALCASLGHDLVEADLPGLDDGVGAAIGTVFNAATAWIVAYWVRHRGREPEPDELDPLTRAYRDAGRRVTAADYLLAVGDLQKFARGVARFLGGAEHGGVDLWLTPTMSAPPARIGEITSTAAEPLRALTNGAPTVAYPLVVANITGNPAMSVPLRHGLGRHAARRALPRPLRRRGHALPVGRPSSKRPGRGRPRCLPCDRPALSTPPDR